MTLSASTITFKVSSPIDGALQTTTLSELLAKAQKGDDHEDEHDGDIQVGRAAGWRALLSPARCHCGAPVLLRDTDRS